jgi:hypothetical protein
MSATCTGSPSEALDPPRKDFRIGSLTTLGLERTEVLAQRFCVHAMNAVVATLL